MTERPNNPVENLRDDSRTNSGEDAISKIAGSLPSNLNELRETAGVSRMMRDGSSSNSAASSSKLNENAASDNAASLGKVLEKLPPAVANRIIESLKDSGASDSAHNSKLKDSGASDSAHSSKDGHLNNAFKERHQGEINKLEKLNPEDFKRFFKEPEVIHSDQKGVMNLSTGDKFIRVPGTEVLVGPNGDTLVVNSDGSFDIGASRGVNIKHDTKSDTTTLTYPNGDTVKISKGRITDVERGFNSVHMNDRVEDLLEALRKVQPPDRHPFPDDRIKPIPFPYPPEPKYPFPHEDLKPIPFPYPMEPKYPFPHDDLKPIPGSGGGGGGRFDKWPSKPSEGIEGKMPLSNRIDGLNKEELEWLKKLKDGNSGK